jgi:hypothetical protein
MMGVGLVDHPEGRRPEVLGKIADARHLPPRSRLPRRGAGGVSGGTPGLVLESNRVRVVDRVAGYGHTQYSRLRGECYPAVSLRHAR